jgi:eukaryotic-like serine/threonine-protein kinase
MISHETNSTAPDYDDPALDDLVDEYLRRLEAGEAITAGSFARAHPEQADRLVDLLPALAAVADFGTSSSQDQGDPQAGDLIPTVGILGDYRLIREIGRGGMGVVYEAEQLSLGRRVALKILPFASALDPRHRQRFQTEAHAAACLHHTHIVPIYTIGSDRGVYYYAMQFVEGRSLAAVIQELRRLCSSSSTTRGGPDPDRLTTTITYPNQSPATFVVQLPRTEPGAPPGSTSMVSPLASSRSSRSRAHFQLVARLGMQAAEALEHSHEQGILHRDIKPSNLLIDERGELWVTDFGLARLLSDPSLTGTGDLLGTLRYMSPEQAQGRRSVVDHRTDIYSLGVTLYELTTLRPVFDGRDRHELLRQIAQEEPAPPRRIAPSTPRDLETIILKAIAKDPPARYDSMKEMADDLGRFLEGRPVHARRPGPVERAARWAYRHRRLVGAGTLVVLVAMAGLAVGSVLLWREQQKTADAKGRIEQNLTLALHALDRFCLDLAEKSFFQEPDRADDVLKLQDDALRLYVHLMNENPSDRQARWEAARAYRRVANIRMRLNQNAEAEATYRSALRLLEQLSNENPKNQPYRREWVEVLLRLGGAKQASSSQPSQDAEQCGYKALALARLMVRDRPLEVDARFALAESLGFLGSYRRLEPEARTMLLEAREILEELIVDEKVRREARMALIETCYALGQWFRFSSHPVDAEEAFGRAVRELDLLVGEAPNDYKYRERIAEIYFVLCCPFICPIDKDVTKAERHYNRALNAWAKLIDDFPKMARFRAELADAHRTMAGFYYQGGHCPKAERALRQAINIYQTLGSEFPQSQEYLDLQAENRYRLARVLIRAGETSQSARELELATSASIRPSLKKEIAAFITTTTAFGPKEMALAIKLGKEIVTAEPNDGDAWGTIGVANHRTKNWADARSAMETSIRLRNGGDAEDWLILATSLWQLGEKDQARRWHDRAMAAIMPWRRR